MDEHDHDQQTEATEDPQATATKGDLAALRAEIKSEFASVRELQCPTCAPAAIVRMHPELGPQPVQAAALRTNAPETPDDPQAA